MLRGRGETILRGRGETIIIIIIIKTPFSGLQAKNKMHTQIVRVYEYDLNAVESLHREAYGTVPRSVDSTTARLRKARLPVCGGGK